MEVFLMIIAIKMLFGLIFSFIYNEPDKQALIISGAITFLTGLFLLLINKRVDYELRNKRDGFIIVSFTWVVISLFGTLRSCFRAPSTISRMLFLKPCQVSTQQYLTFLPILNRQARAYCISEV